MSLPRKILVYGVIAVGGLIAVSILISVISTIVTTVLSIIGTIISLTVLVLLLYGGAKLLLWMMGSTNLGSVTDSSSGSDSSANQSEPTDLAERAREQYVRGEIGEEELDRRLGRYTSGVNQDEIDRELERSRN